MYNYYTKLNNINCVCVCVFICQFIKKYFTTKAKFI